MCKNWFEEQSGEDVSMNCQYLYKLADLLTPINAFLAISIILIESGN